MVYQVKGDAEYMTYNAPNRPVDITSSASFLAMYQLAVVTEQQAAVVKDVADNEIPLRAPSPSLLTRYPYLISAVKIMAA